MFPEILSLSSWFQTFIILLLVLLLLSSLTNKHRANNLPPSPPRFPIIGNLHQLGKLPHRSLWKLSQKHGPVMLLHFGNTPVLIISSPETAKQVLKTHDIDCCSRPPSFGATKMTYNLHDIAFAPYDHYWREIRKLCVAELFSTKRVHFFQFIRDQEVANLIQELCNVSKNPVAVNEKIFDHMNTIICKIAFGRSYRSNHFQNYELEKGIYEGMAMLDSFWAADYFPVFGKIVDKVTGMQSRLDKCFRNFDDFLERVIDEHLDPRRPKPGRDHIIDILLGLSKNETAPIHLTRDQIKAITFDILIAGTDTSSLTTIWAMAELARNPRIMKKVQTEIRVQVGKKSMVEVDDIDNLNYLKMVVKETFRVHPTTPLLLPRVTMRHCTIGGFNVYPKTRILVNAFAVGRNPSAWKNPEEFWPERFEETDIDFRGRHFELVPFGGGRRICPALSMGALAVEFTLANLLHCFDWEMPEGMRGGDICMGEEAGLTVRKKCPLVLVPIQHKLQA